MKRPYERNPRGHVWQTDEDGELDIFAANLDGQYCNGPRCVNCGYEFCHHCDEGVDSGCPNRKERAK